MKEDEGTNPQRGKELLGETLADAITELYQLPIFAELDQATRTTLGSVIPVRLYRAGAVVVKYGERANSCFVVIRGVVSARRMDPRGKELTYRNLGAGSIFGEVALLTGKNRSTDVVAEEASILAEIPAKTFQELLAASPKFSNHLMTSLAERLRTSSERLSDLAFLDLNQRLLLTLSRLATEVDLDGEKRSFVRELPSRQHLASLLSCTREAVSRALKYLEGQGLIIVRGEQAEICIAKQDVQSDEF